MSTPHIKTENLRPELEKAFARIPTLNVGKASTRWLMTILGHILSARTKVPNVTISVEDLGNAKARIYIPAGTLSGAAILWIHGGGYVLGKAAINDRECSEHAERLGVVVVSVEYRVAPKHPYPAAIDDCFDVWCWMQKQAERLGVEAHRIAIAGQSAGGGLAAALCQRILDSGGEQPAAQCLYYPMLDDRTAANVDLNAVKYIGWDNRSNHYGWSAYLGQPPGSSDVPPWGAPGRRTELAGLPPAWIGVGDLDLFLEENIAYAERLKEAGCPTELLIITGAPHGFDNLVPNAEVSQDFVDSARKFLTLHLQIQPATEKER